MAASLLQKLRPWDRSHCRQAAFALFHCRMLQCPVGRKACGKSGQSKQTIKYFYYASQATNGAYAHPVFTHVNYLDKLGCGRNNKWSFNSRILKSIDEWKFLLQQYLSCMYFGVMEPVCGLYSRGRYFRNFWVGMCRWDPGILNLYQS